jgi:hypothetical protein
MSGSDRYQALAREQLNFAPGVNGWDTSVVVGAEQGRGLD